MGLRNVTLTKFSIELRKTRHIPNATYVLPIHSAITLLVTLDNRRISEYKRLPISLSINY